MTSQHSQAAPGPTGHSAHTAAEIALVERYAAHNYHPLPVVLTHGEGAWVTDVDGRRYLDCLAGLLRAELRARPPAPARPRPGAARAGSP